MFNFSFEEWARFGSLGMEKGTPGREHRAGRTKDRDESLEGSPRSEWEAGWKEGWCGVKLEVIQIHLVPA